MCLIRSLFSKLRRNRPLLVVIESPYAGDVESNVAYARQCMKDSLLRGEYPICSHLLYTQPGILDDGVPDERTLGITAGQVWSRHADVRALYLDRGITKGMEIGIQEAKRLGQSISYRYLNSDISEKMGCIICHMAMAMA